MVVIEGEVCDKSPKGGKNLPGLSVISHYDASIATFPKKYDGDARLNTTIFT
jgi:hypothetical protein